MVVIIDLQIAIRDVSILSLKNNTLFNIKENNSKERKILKRTNMYYVYY